ncbi:MAG TPA: hypothetical protein VMF11_00335 [Candidatus Baltobacteraceae bacterium]|nr:hypothetical protein [Candidatus Baltobacteraceae bacterium]
MRAALMLDLTPNLADIVVPFTVIVPYDPAIDSYRGYPNESAKRAVYQRWVAHTRFGRVVMIAPSRHFVMFDRPNAFEATLTAVLSRDR